MNINNRPVMIFCFKFIRWGRPPLSLAFTCIYLIRVEYTELDHMTGVTSVDTLSRRSTYMSLSLKQEL